VQQQRQQQQQQQRPQQPASAWAWLSESTFTAMRLALAPSFVTNTQLHVASVNERLVKDAARVLADELLLAGAPGMAAGARRHVARCAVSALLDPSDQLWQLEAWEPGGAIMPVFNRAPTFEERAAIQGLRLYLWGMRLDLERADTRQQGRGTARTANLQGVLGFRVDVGNRCGPAPSPSRTPFSPHKPAAAPRRKRAASTRPCPAGPATHPFKPCAI
jgi:hypothetical protein